MFSFARSFLAALLLLSPALVGNAQADQPMVQLSLTGGAGYLGQSQSYYYDSFDGTMSAQASRAGASGLPRYVSVSFLGLDLGTFADAVFGTDQLGVDLLPGSYPNAQRAPFASAGYAGLDVDLNGRGCNTVTGSFNVLDATYVGTTIQRFDATFVENCDGTQNALTGRVRINEPSALLSAVLPGSRSVQLGTRPTVFATMINTSSAALSNCRIRLPGALTTGVGLSFQATDPSTNLPVAPPNQPVILAANGSQSFVITMNGSTAQSKTALPIDFVCDGTMPAPVLPGVNTLDIDFASSAVPDVIALSATVTGDGTVAVPFSQNGTGAFAVATANVGTAANLIVSADTGSAGLPVSLTLCETNPVTAQCLAPPAGSIVHSFAAGETPTFSIFAKATGQIPFAPATSRIFVRFLDNTSQSHGSTSVAVKTN
ncbi:MAG TPA: hypothetical protein VKQ29_11245 [Aliidongia sp.]|nr:hypothetical protein [Aliidongia sp.]